MHGLTLIVAALLISIMIIIVFAWKSPSENYRIKARAYHSCPPTNCMNKFVTEENSLVKNPFKWPYSGSNNPQYIIEDTKQEQDHDVTVT